MRSLLALALCGCGSTPPPAAPPLPRPHAPPVVARPAPRIEPTSCRDAAIILRASADEATAEREPALATLCVDDAWSRQILDCIGDKPSKHETCLDQLPPDHRKRYDDRVAATRPQRHLDCENNVGRVETYAPSLDAFTGLDRSLLLQLRREAVELRCVTDAWEQPVLHCFAAGRDAAACRALLSPAQEAALVGALAPLQALGTKVVAAQQRPAALSCKAIAAAHYSDRAWANQEPALVGAARKKAIAELRTWLERSCTDEHWSSTLRACISVGTMASCQRAIGTSDVRWDFTSLATPFGIPACDQLARTVASSIRCDKFRQIETRKTVDAVRERVRKGDPRDEISEQCDEGESDVAARIVDAGCKP